MSMIIGLVVGGFIGWNMPQPEWAKKVQAFVIAKVKEFLARKV